jgi:inhibitor of KinA
VQVGERISAESRAMVRAAYAALSRLATPALLDMTPAYTTVLLTFDPLLIEDRDAVRARIEEALRELPVGEPASGRLVEIPVCYGEEFGPDLVDVARLHGLAPAAVVALHSGAEYQVEFIGFSPGFPYLSGLPERLATPRLDTPRARVPAGSVGIGGEQTGIYPQATPGGWRIIGRTPRRLFDASREEPALLRWGDRVRLRPVSVEEFRTLEGGGG